MHISLLINRFPDENFAREIMQLFTIGLVELFNDGTPRLDAQNSTIRTYDSQDIISYAKAWTGFARQLPRSNHESSRGTNRFDPMRLIASTRDRFPKADLAGGFIGDKVSCFRLFSTQVHSRLPPVSFVLGTARTIIPQKRSQVPTIGISVKTRACRGCRTVERFTTGEASGGIPIKLWTL